MSKASAQAATPAEGSILALDAAGRSCSAALWDGNRIVAQRFALMERGQAEALIPMIGAVMADFPFERLERIAVSRGRSSDFPPLPRWQPVWHRRPPVFPVFWFVWKQSGGSFTCRHTPPVPNPILQTIPCPVLRPASSLLAPPA